MTAPQPRHDDGMRPPDALPDLPGTPVLDGASAVALIGSQALVASPRCGHVVVVAIDGPSGSGKTTLAADIARLLACPVVHMDDLYPGWNGLLAGIGYLVAEVLSPLAAGESAHYRVWDWGSGGRGGQRALAPQRFLVVEGCGASVGEASAYIGVRVWVEAPRKVRRARGLARDGDAYRPFWEHWAFQEEAVFAADATRARADVIVST